MKNSRLEWQEAKDVKKDINKIIKTLELSHIKSSRIYSYRTEGSKARAYARTWAFPKIFQTVLEIEPAYVIEVLNKYYNKLTEEEKTKVLIHELLHIPRNFSGSLLPHSNGYKTIEREVDRIYREMKGRE